MNVLQCSRRMQHTYVVMVLLVSLIIDNVNGAEYIKNVQETANKMESNVSCGSNLYAPNCSQCPFDKRGNYHGGFRCGGDCQWSDDKCQENVIETKTGTKEINFGLTTCDSTKLE